METEKNYHEMLRTDGAFMWLAFLQPKQLNIVFIFCEIRTNFKPLSITKLWEFCQCIINKGEKSINDKNA